MFTLCDDETGEDRIAEALNEMGWSREHAVAIWPDLQATALILDSELTARIPASTHRMAQNRPGLLMDLFIRLLYLKPAILKVGILTKSGVGMFFRPSEPSVPDVSCQKGRNKMLRFHALHPPDRFRTLTFRKGDTVFVAKGSCHGTVGTFLNFRDDDPNWADIFERGSQVRSHPVEWLEHIPS